MQFGNESNIIVLKLENDEDVLESIERAAESNDIRSAIIMAGLGMIKDFELGYYNPGGYKTKNFTEPHELISMTGSIAYDGSDNTKLLPHIHCSVADQKNQVWGGHLFRAKVNVINEITLLKFDKLQLNRIKNESTGLMELNIE
ncbi:PPC domain-containing DNA-binding protein [[Eubacterium] cellulosolvens]